MARNIIVNGVKAKVSRAAYEWYKSTGDEASTECCTNTDNSAGYRCTRAPGHDGFHVAHGLRNNVIAVWDNDQKGEDDVTKTIRMNGEDIEISDNHYNALADLFHNINKPDCGSVEPGMVYRCTCEKGHEGMHVAHYADKRVISAWDEEYKYGDADNQVKETNMGKKVRVNGEMRVLDNEQYQYYASKSGKQGEPLCRDAEPREYGNDGWHCTCKKDHSGSCVAHHGLGGKVLSVWSVVDKIEIKD